MTALLHHGLGPPSTVTVEQQLPGGRLLVRFANGGTMIVPAHLTGPTARATDPDTSHAAAVQARAHATRDEELVLRSLAQLGASTDHEVAAATGRLQTSLGVRRKALVDQGLVEWSGAKRPTPTGVLARVWRLTEAGERAAALLGREAA